jgi:transcriptional regulator with XRE-family HTH domain
VKLINRRLRELRLSLGLSQEAIGAQGFVSAPGWAKMENGTRQPSDLLLTNLVAWLVKDRYIKKNESGLLLDELLTLKYMGHLSPFIRDLARRHHDLHFVQSHSLLKVAEHPKE